MAFSSLAPTRRFNISSRPTFVSKNHFPFCFAAASFFFDAASEAGTRKAVTRTAAASAIIFDEIILFRFVFIVFSPWSFGYRRRPPPPRPPPPPPRLIPPPPMLWPPLLLLARAWFPLPPPPNPPPPREAELGRDDALWLPTWFLAVLPVGRVDGLAPALPPPGRFAAP